MPPKRTRKRRVVAARGAERPSAPEIEIRFSGRSGADAARCSAQCRAVLKRAARGLALGSLHEISVLLCDGPAIRRINARWRGKDRPTNVLSFPAADLKPGRRPPKGPLGDIIVALPVVRREARSMGIPFEDHFAHLLVHGLLHLLGHDHGNNREAGRMEAEERRLLGPGKCR
jgi:probable rRNA maturation factor